MSASFALHAYVRCTNRSRGLDICNMLRGLANHVGGFRSIAGQTDAVYLNGRPLRFSFRSDLSRRNFERKAQNWFAADVVIKRLSQTKS